MKQRIVHGAMIDAVTADEMYAMIPRPEQRTHIRVPATVELDASGNGGLSVYKVPIGYEFELRRITFDLGNVTAANLQTGTVALTAVGTAVEYLRSGLHLGWANPQSPVGSQGRVPGTETWGDQQGPYLSNGDVFQVQVALGAGSANVSFTVTAEGILTVNRPNA